MEDSLRRVHKRIDEQEKLVAKIETHTAIIKDSVQDMHRVIFGNGKDGIITKIVRLFERVSLHTKIITSTVIAVIIGFVGLIFKLISK